jgi:hypothetical protein
MDRRDRRRREFVQSKPSSFYRNGAHRRHVGQGRCNRKTSVSPQTAFEVQIKDGRSSSHRHVQTRVSERLSSQLVAGNIRDLRKISDIPGDLRTQRFSGRTYKRKILRAGNSESGQDRRRLRNRESSEDEGTRWENRIFSQVERLSGQIQ